MKFDQETVVYQLPEEQKLEDEKCSSTHQSAPIENSKFFPTDISKSPIVANGNWPKKETSLNKDTNPFELHEKQEWKERLVCKGRSRAKSLSRAFGHLSHYGSYKWTLKRG